MVTLVERSVFLEGQTRHRTQGRGLNAPPLIMVTRMLTRDLFAAANLVHIQKLKGAYASASTAYTPYIDTAHTYSHVQVHKRNSGKNYFGVR